MIESLIEKIRQVKPDRSRTGEYLSVIFPIEPITVETLLDLPQSDVYYLHSNEETVLGLGKALTLQSDGPDRFKSLDQKLDQVRSQLDVINPDNIEEMPRFMGGFTFTTADPTEIWEDFSPAAMVLPVLLIIQHRRSAVAILSGQNTEDIITSLKEVKMNLSGHAQPSQERLKVTHVNYPTTLEMWQSTVDKAQGLMDSSNLEKVVLSRVTEIETEKTITPSTVITSLIEEYPNCYQFFIKPSQDTWFYGASPELLCQVNCDVISTVALAGTRRRGRTEVEDKELMNELHSSSKERYEHQLVVDAIVSNLNPYTNQVSRPEEPSIRKMSNVMHLETKITGKLQTGHSVLELMQVLHPTPALGGTPRECAIRFIDKYEPHPRGLYASPIGWIDLDGNGTVVVAIRSAVTRNRITWLYAGAGIVRQSDAAQEWDEIELKYKPMMKALGVKL